MRKIEINFYDYCAQHAFDEMSADCGYLIESINQNIKNHIYRVNAANKIREALGLIVLDIAEQDRKDETHE